MGKVAMVQERYWLYIFRAVGLFQGIPFEEEHCACLKSCLKQLLVKITIFWFVWLWGEGYIGRRWREERTIGEITSGKTISSVKTKHGTKCCALGQSHVPAVLRLSLSSVLILFLFLCKCWQRHHLYPCSKKLCPFPRGAGATWRGDS